MSTVDTDALCRHCSYNLRGLPATSLCPECATPIPDSLRSDELRYAPTPWLRNLSYGLPLYRTVLLATAARESISTARWLIAPFDDSYLYPALSLVAALPLALGALLLTAREPGTNRPRFRTPIRIALCLPLIRFACIYLVLIPYAMPTTLAGRWAWHYAFGAVEAAFVVGTFLLFRHAIIPIASRIPQSSVPRLLSRLAATYVAVSGTNVLLTYASPLADTLLPARAYYWIAATAAVAEILTLLALVITLRHLSRPIRRALLGPVPPPSPPR